MIWRGKAGGGHEEMEVLNIDGGEEEVEDEDTSRNDCRHTGRS